MQRVIRSILDTVWMPLLQFLVFLRAPLSFHRTALARDFGVGFTLLCIAAAGERFAAAKKAEATALFLAGTDSVPALFSWMNYPVTGELFLVLLAVLYTVSWYPATLVWGMKGKTEKIENTLTLLLSFWAISSFVAFCVHLPFIVLSEMNDLPPSELFRLSRQSQLASGGVKLAMFAIAILNVRRMNADIPLARFLLGFLAFVLCWGLLMYLLFRILVLSLA
jgi:hypothetical protein